MKKEKLINFINYYFKEFGNQQIIDEHSIDHDIDIYVHDIRKGNDGKFWIFIDSEPIRLEHSIEDDGGETVSFSDVVWEELKTCLSHLGLDIWNFRYFFNKRTLMPNVPFDQISISENVKVRVFKESVDSDELKWHRDREDRIVEVIESNNWFLQMDNELPKKLLKGKKYHIPEGVFHRVIKGKGDLKIKVTLK